MVFGGVTDGQRQSQGLSQGSNQGKIKRKTKVLGWVIIAELFICFFEKCSGHPRPAETRIAEDHTPCLSYTIGCTHSFA